MSLREIASLIERTARWVAPDTFKLLPLWFPEHGRRGLFYKENWSAPQMNKNRATGHSIHKSEGNVHANKALTLALGLRSKHRPNWSCCHIWGVDDARYQLSNAIVMDRRFFSCVGNMVLLPTPLKAFTDAMPDVKAMIRICARNLYNWPPGSDDFLSANAAVDKWTDWDGERMKGRSFDADGDAPEPSRGDGIGEEILRKYAVQVEDRVAVEAGFFRLVDEKFDGVLVVRDHLRVPGVAAFGLLAKLDQAPRIKERIGIALKPTRIP